MSESLDWARTLLALGADEVDAIAGEAARLEDWLDGVAFRPRFRVPLEKELAASD